ncbi:hypothetical protein [Halpernia sp. GG3]
MKIIIFAVFANFLLLIISCKENSTIFIQKICRVENNNEIDIYLRNNTAKNYYILGSQCIINDGSYYRAGILNSSNYKNFAIIDTIAKNVYNFIDKTPSGKEKAIPIIFLKSRKTVRLTFKFNQEIKKYPNVSISFPFNDPPGKLSFPKKRKLEIKLQNIKLESDYNFYSKEINKL